jgi:hypothetical protein
MKGKYLASTAAVALLVGLGVASGPAKAFDTVNWQWNKNKVENVWANKWTWGWFTPDGETQVEQLQLFVGNVSAKTRLNGDYNQVGIAGGDVTVPINETVDVALDYTDGDPTTTTETSTNPVGSVDFNGSNPGTAGPLSLSYNGGGNVDEVTEGVTFSFDINGDVVVHIDPQEISNLDATTQLGHALQNAQAVGAVSTIDSVVPVYSHEGQYIIGDIGPFCDSTCDPNDMANVVASLGLVNDGSTNFAFSGNRFHDIAALLVLGRALGLVEKSYITAEATAGTKGWFGGMYPLSSESNGYVGYSDPVEIAVKQDVTAVAGQLGITLQSATAPTTVDSQGNAETGLPYVGDTVNMKPYGSSDGVPWLATYRPKDTNLILESDITQVGFADVKARATAYQDLSHYTNLGQYTGLDATRPGLVAQQNAVAAGLIKTISVSVAPPTTPTTP